MQANKRLEGSARTYHHHRHFHRGRHLHPSACFIDGAQLMSGLVDKESRAALRRPRSAPLSYLIVMARAYVLQCLNI